MDYRTALAELGFEEDADPTHEQLRRTYLRRLREHPPERDPEGFKRLRRAFEILRETVDDEPAAETESSVAPHVTVPAVEPPPPPPSLPPPPPPPAPPPS